MKNKIIVLMMALMLVGLVAGTAAAADWEMTGGMAITNTTLDAWNEKIDALNENVFSQDPDGEEMENIDRVPMIYLGAEKSFNDKWSGSVRYEYIFGTIEGEANAAAIGGENTGEIDVKLHGISALADYSLNERWSLNGGIGFYSGTKRKDFEGYAFENNLLADDPANDPNPTPSDTEYDLSAVSYRLGVGYERSFAQNWSFNAGLDYLYMEIEDDDPTEAHDIYSAGFSYNAGLTYSF